MPPSEEFLRRVQNAQTAFHRARVSVYADEPVSNLSFSHDGKWMTWLDGAYWRELHGIKFPEKEKEQQVQQISEEAVGAATGVEAEGEEEETKKTAAGVATVCSQRLVSVEDVSKDSEGRELSETLESRLQKERRRANHMGIDEYFWAPSANRLLLPANGALWVLEKEAETTKEPGEKEKERGSGSSGSLLSSLEKFDAVMGLQRERERNREIYRLEWRGIGMGGDEEERGGGAIINPKWLPDNKRVSFVQGGAIKVVEAARDKQRKSAAVDVVPPFSAGGREVGGGFAAEGPSQRERETGGKEGQGGGGGTIGSSSASSSSSSSTSRLRGVAEYVAQEEMHRSDGYWWAPSGRFIAFTEVNESHISPLPIVYMDSRNDSKTGSAQMEFHKYPFAGQRNAEVRVGVVDAVASLERPEGTLPRILWLKLSAGEERSDLYVTNVLWQEGAGIGGTERVMVAVQNRAQTVLSFLSFDPRTGDALEVYRSTDARWVTLPNPKDVRWLPPQTNSGASRGGKKEGGGLEGGSGRLLVPSEKDGVMSLYCVSAPSGRGMKEESSPTRLTPGTHRFTRLVAVGDEFVVWQGLPLSSPQERHLFVSRLPSPMQDNAPLPPSSVHGGRALSSAAASSRAASPVPTAPQGGTFNIATPADTKVPKSAKLTGGLKTTHTERVPPTPSSPPNLQAPPLVVSSSSSVGASPPTHFAEGAFVLGDGASDRSGGQGGGGGGPEYIQLSAAHLRGSNDAVVSPQKNLLVHFFSASDRFLSVWIRSFDPSAIFLFASRTRLPPPSNSVPPPELGEWEGCVGTAGVRAGGEGGLFSGNVPGSPTVTGMGAPADPTLPATPERGDGGAFVASSSPLREKETGAEGETDTEKRKRRTMERLHAMHQRQGKVLQAVSAAAAATGGAASASATPIPGQVSSAKTHAPPGRRSHFSLSPQIVDLSGRPSTFKIQTTAVPGPQHTPLSLHTLPPADSMRSYTLHALPMASGPGRAPSPAIPSVVPSPPIGLGVSGLGAARYTTNMSGLVRVHGAATVVAGPPSRGARRLTHQPEEREVIPRSVSALRYAYFPETSSGPLGVWRSFDPTGGGGTVLTTGVGLQSLNEGGIMIPPPGQQQVTLRQTLPPLWSLAPTPLGPLGPHQLQVMPPPPRPPPTVFRSRPAGSLMPPWGGAQARGIPGSSAIPQAPPPFLVRRTHGPAHSPLLQGTRMKVAMGGMDVTNTPEAPPTVGSHSRSSVRTFDMSPGVLDRELTQEAPTPVVHTENSHGAAPAGSRIPFIPSRESEPSNGEEGGMVLGPCKFHVPNLSESPHRVVLEEARKVYRTPTRFSFVSSTGHRLFGFLYLPDEELHGPPPYAPIVSVYGGPEIQFADDSISQYLDHAAQCLRLLGFLVVKVDNRGSGFASREFEKAVWKRAGSVELDDQAEAVAFLQSRGLAAASHAEVKGWAQKMGLCEVGPEDVLKRRVGGIYGISYGGFLSAGALVRKHQTFSAAVACSSLTFWEGYDTHYTERYMGTDLGDPAYAECSLLDLVTREGGKVDWGDTALTLVHGALDENVHLRHSLALLNCLMDFRYVPDLVILPDSRHGPSTFKDLVIYRDKLFSTFVETLGSPVSKLLVIPPQNFTSRPRSAVKGTTSEPN